MELHREEKGEEGGDRGDREERRGVEGERPVLPVIHSLIVIHSSEHPDIFTVLNREEKGGRKRQRFPGGEREGQKWRKQSNQ